MAVRPADHQRVQLPRLEVPSEAPKAKLEKLDSPFAEMTQGRTSDPLSRLRMRGAGDEIRAGLEKRLPPDPKQIIDDLKDLLEQFDLGDPDELYPMTPSRPDPQELEELEQAPDAPLTPKPANPQPTRPDAGPQTLPPGFKPDTTRPPGIEEEHEDEPPPLAEGQAEYNGIRLNMAGLKDDDPKVVQIKQALDFMKGDADGSKLLEALNKKGYTIELDTSKNPKGAGATSTGTLMTIGDGALNGKKEGIGYLVEIMGHEMNHGISRHAHEQGGTGGAEESIGSTLGRRMRAHYEGVEWNDLDDELSFNGGVKGEDGDEAKNIEKLRELGIEFNINTDPDAKLPLEPDSTDQKTVDSVISQLKGKGVQNLYAALGVGKKNGTVTEGDLNNLLKDLPKGDANREIVKRTINDKEVTLTPADIAAVRYMMTADMNGTTIWDSMDGDDSKIWGENKDGNEFLDLLNERSWKVGDIKNH